MSNPATTATRLSLLDCDEPSASSLPDQGPGDGLAVQGARTQSGLQLVTGYSPTASNLQADVADVECPMEPVDNLPGLGIH